MEKIGLVLLGLVVIFGALFAFWIYPSYVKDPEYAVYSEVSFSVSGDSDVDFNKDIRVFSVDENCWMKYKVKVSSDNKKGDGSEVFINVTIPKVDHVQAINMEGKTIEPEKVDTINNTTTYRFAVQAYKNVDDSPLFIFKFQFVPNSSGYISITFDYDDPVPRSFDNSIKIQFVDNGAE